jgi:hypothetical protein
LERILKDPPPVDLHLGDPPEKDTLNHPAPCRSTGKKNPHGKTPNAM